MKPPSNFFTTFKKMVYDAFGKNPGGMLIATSAISWLLSSAAHIGAVLFNDKIQPEQKAFLVPQEAADALVNIASFIVVTASLKNMTGMMVQFGKLTTPKIKKFITDKGLTKSVGSKLDLINTAKHGDIANHVSDFKRDAEVVATIIGSIISCSIITPILRNKYASKRQKTHIARMDAYHQNRLQPAKGLTMNDYITNSQAKYSGNLKI